MYSRNKSVLDNIKFHARSFDPKYKEFEEVRNAVEADQGGLSRGCWDKWNYDYNTALAKKIEGQVGTYMLLFIRPIFTKWRGLFQEIALDVETKVLKASDEESFATQKEKVVAKLQTAFEEFKQKRKTDGDLYMDRAIYRYCGKVKEELEKLSFEARSTGRRAPAAAFR